jgi:hypothetical protein
VVSNDPYNPTPPSTSILVLDQANAEMSSPPASETLPPASARSSSSIPPPEPGPVGQVANNQSSIFERIRNFTQRKHLNQNR